LTHKMSHAPRERKTEKVMFKSVKRITYRVSDLVEARKWYVSVLDMPPILELPFVIIFKVGDCTLSLSKMNNPADLDSGQIEVYWEVEDIDTSFKKLMGLGAREHTPITERLNFRIAKVIDPFGNILGITGLPMDASRRTVENKPSESALVLAFCRALAARDEREEVKGPDYLAEYFLTEEAKKPLKDSESRKWAVEKMITSPKYGYSISRTAYIDGIFKKYLSENIPQIVILGAGYDSRAYRFHDLLGATKVFEVDIRATQLRKIDILKASNIEIPVNNTFVSINFETENLEDVLVKSGFRIGEKTVYIWEGVTYYLTKGTVHATLNFINTHSSKGSVVCFDYLAEKIDSMNTAEPYRFIIGKEDLGLMLSECGLEIIEYIDFEDMIKRYLTLKDGAKAEEALTSFCFVTAIVI